MSERAVDVLRSLGDWRLDKAIEHMASLRRIAKAAGLSEHDLAWIDRYHGWFLMAREKIDGVLGVDDQQIDGVGRGHRE